ncbi:MAG: UbiA family prenyltransferase, partial [Gammaproteobacteria bacterium]|nr:UbiA family prenyltransferase [Gammaproteobacteria bacterium]
MESLRLLASVSRLHIVAIATLGTFTFGWLFTGDYPWLLAGICALDWFIVNLLNRVVDLEEDKVNRITGVAFVDRNRRAIVVAGFALLIGSLVAVAFLHPELTLLRLGYHSLGLAYNWPILPGRRRIKELYFFKNTASAAGFIITVFLYPLALAGWGADPAQLAPGITPATIWVTVAYFVLFELSYEVIYDLRDEEGDRAANVRTYPVVHGAKGAMRIIDGLIFVSAAILALGYASGVVPWRIFVMIVAPFLNLAFYKRAVKRGITSADCVTLAWVGAALLL